MAFERDGQKFFAGAYRQYKTLEPDNPKSQGNLGRYRIRTERDLTEHLPETMRRQKAPGQKVRAMIHTGTDTITLTPGLTRKQFDTSMLNELYNDANPEFTYREEYPKFFRRSANGTSGKQR